MNYNYVEEKVDTFMVDKLEVKYPGVKGKVTKASKHSKRLAIASILGDPKTFELIKKTLDLQKSDEYLTNLDELIVLFRKYVGIADVEKKTLGEVMTPITLVEDMLNTLPSEVWTNPNLKWLDPCAGVGTFPSIVVQRLMKGLEKVIPNPEKRYGHIIENMIYVCELQEKNLFVFNCVFDLGDNNATNSYCGSFLDENFDKHMTDVWGVEKFDIIIGNPPYQTSNDGGKTQPIWNKFVNKSISILSEGGYLNMVHPSGWRNIDGKFKETQTILKSREMLYLEMHTISDGLKVFGAETRYDFYCLKNTLSDNHLTTIKCQDGEIVKVNIKHLDFIPSGKFKEIANLMSGDEKVNVLHSESAYETRKTFISKVKTENHIYPIVYRVRKDGTLNFIYSSRKDRGHFDIPKLIWSDGRVISVGSHIDENGELGMNQFQFAIVDDVDNLQNIKKAFDSNGFRKLMEYCAVSNLSINYRVVASFRKDFYKQFLND
jgi:hypothetical protein